MAFQSVIMLMVLPRVRDVAAAGVFTLAYANANLFLNLGKYGVRNYQVSDVRARFSFWTYLRARAISTFAMPVFVVGLLASFVYNPIIASLAEDWETRCAGRFARRLGMQALIIVGITLVCILGALICGIPVLGTLYNADLSPYRVDLLILLAGGGFLALATLLTMGITIMRRQGLLVPGYAVVAVFAAVLSPWAVGLAGVDGASWIYLALMVVLTLWFTVVFALGVRRGDSLPFESLDPR